MWIDVWCRLNKGPYCVSRYRRERSEWRLFHIWKIRLPACMYTGLQNWERGKLGLIPEQNRSSNIRFSVWLTRPTRFRSLMRRFIFYDPSSEILYRVQRKFLKDIPSVCKYLQKGVVHHLGRNHKLMYIVYCNNLWSHVSPNLILSA